ncbi:MAG: hypothetical protein WBB29_11415 [Geitlerinemataceae cyanobacterium]
MSVLFELNRHLKITSLKSPDIFHSLGTFFIFHKQQAGTMSLAATPGNTSTPYRKNTAPIASISPPTRFYFRQSNLA